LFVFCIESDCQRGWGSVKWLTWSRATDTRVHLAGVITQDGDVVAVHVA